MTGTQAAADTSLGKVIRASGYFALSFGSIVGSGWVLVMGDWLGSAGPGGAILGFAAGGVAMLLIGACYAELAARMPWAGGEFIYAHQTLGPGAGFGVGWFLTLFCLSICAFEGIALTVLVQLLFPDIGGPVLYRLLGAEVTLGGVLVGSGGALAIALCNYVGVRAAVAVQKAVTFGFIGVAAVLMVLALWLGDIDNARPLFAGRGDASWQVGTFWVFALCAMFLTGFQASVHAIEERHPDTTVRSVVHAMMAGLVAAALFYCILILAVASAAPWQVTLAKPLPAADAFAGLVEGVPLRTLVLVAATASLLKTWNATFLITTRLLMAQARLGFLPPRLTQQHERFRSPTVAIALVTLISLAAILLGRGAILPIVNMCSMCIALNFAVAVFVLHKQRAQNPERPAFVVPGGAPMLVVAGVVAIGMAAILIFEPLTRAETGAAPLEWQMMAGWAILGIVIFKLREASRRLRLSVET